MIYSCLPFVNNLEAFPQIENLSLTIAYYLAPGHALEEMMRGYGALRGQEPNEPRISQTDYEPLGRGSVC